MLGTFLTYKGNIFKASICFIIADTCWIYLSFYKYLITSDIIDLIGFLFIILGTLIGILTFLKMNFGKMRKTLDW